MFAFIILFSLFLRSPMAAPRAAGQQRDAQRQASGSGGPPTRPGKKAVDEDNDFADADVIGMLG
jgi:hypothetical protein